MILHNSQSPYYRSPRGAVPTDTTVRLALDITDEKLKVESVKLYTWQESLGATYKKMMPSAWDENHYIIDLQMPEEGCLVWYYFVIRLEDESLIYYGNSSGQMGGIGKAQKDVPTAYQITVFKADAKTPDWFKKSVMYQIFPDRFYRSGNELPQKPYAVFHCDWNDPPMYYVDPDTRRVIAYDFFGGNFKGIEEKLDYLKDLGISVIYLNPIFLSRSNHHYDTANYFQTDPMLGTNEDFEHLCQVAEQKGIKIILDGVFSHTGSDSIYFNRFGNYPSVGAYQSKDSPYYEWYDFKEYPDKYDCWWGFDSMPNVKETTPAYMDYIINDENSVINYWMKKGISGWRLDVIDELPRQFSRAFYKKMKSIDKDAVLIGEIWEDASNKVSYNVSREYLCGYEVDSAMNYPLRNIMLDFLLNKNDAKITQQRIANQQENYPAENLYAMMNLLGSHDVERVLTLLGEAPSIENVPTTVQADFRLDDEHLRLAIFRLKIAVCWQMTLPGVPSIYYGDEIGMQGYRDPHNRASYNWDNGDWNLRYFVKRMVALRNNRAVLQTGWYVPAYADGDVLAYFRTTKLGKDRFGNDMDDDCILVVLNRNNVKSATITVDMHGFCQNKIHEITGMYPDVEIIDNKAQITIEPLKALIFEQVKITEPYTRQAGIILHPTSLPSAYGIGDLGKTAYDFVDWLAKAGQSIWQVLPLNPVGYGASPYQSPSAFAGNIMLISPEELVRMGLLTEDDIKLDYEADEDRVDFVKVEAYKNKILHKAFVNFVADEDYSVFCAKQESWLDDYALFMALKKHFKGENWTKWDTPIRRRQPQALQASRIALAHDIAYIKFTQYIFFMQWQKLHEYAKEKGIKIIGDVPIFPSHDSADVWTNQDQFNLNPDGTLKTAAGVPPDYFSEDGQLWGNPHYLWKVMERDSYAWWRKRIATLLELVDIIRIDHFRGFEAYWEVPGDAKNARIGKWVKGPGRDLFDTIKKYLGNVPIIAEDLGIITPEVEKLKTDCGFPGMKVLQFELYPNAQKELNFTCPQNSIVYTGTHDNNTTLGWLETDIAPQDKALLAEFLNVSIDENEALLNKLIELAYFSQARLAVLPMQDVLGLDGNARMNLPGTVGKNWGWRMHDDALTDERAKWLKSLTQKYHR